jgi:hypothetical protein
MIVTDRRAFTRRAEHEKIGLGSGRAVRGLSSLSACPDRMMTSQVAGEVIKSYQK